MFVRQNKSTEGCSKLKRSADITSSGMNCLNIRTNASLTWDRTRCPEEWASSVGKPHPLQMSYGNLPESCNNVKNGEKVQFSKAPVRHTLQPLCDLSATDNFHQSQRSQQGPQSVPARLQRSRRLIGDLVATKSVAGSLHKNLAATDLVADRSRQSRRPVPDQSPTDRRLILLESGRGYHWN